MLNIHLPLHFHAMPHTSARHAAHVGTCLRHVSMPVSMPETLALDLRCYMPKACPYVRGMSQLKKSLRFP